MSMQALREFINQHNAYATGLSALCAAIDAKANNTPLPGALAANVDGLLAALGAGDVLSDVSADELKPLLPELRHQLLLNGKLLHAATRTTAWTFSDPDVLQDIGDFARAHAHAITQKLVPSLEGGAFAERFAAKGASFLDIGVGVAGTAIQMAELWPNLRIVGIDVWQPSLALARTHVKNAKLEQRIELREQAAENLDDDKAFDLAWMPIPFMSERIIPQAIERTLRSLRPGGWMIVAFPNLDGLDPVTTALWRLRLTTWGGPNWSASQVETHVRDKGFTDVRTMPRPPGVPVGLTIGRKA